MGVEGWLGGTIMDGFPHECAVMWEGRPQCSRYSSRGPDALACMAKTGLATQQDHGRHQFTIKHEKNDNRPKFEV